MDSKSKEINILLIEDNPTDYHLTSKMFSALQGERVVNLDWSKSYEDAQQAISKKQHDMYLVDYSLGSRTGLDLVEDSHTRNKTDKPFVLLTDFEASSLYERSIELGIYDHILKRELSPSVLERTITYTLQRFKTEQDLKLEKEFNAFILAEIPYFIISVDQDSMIASVNPAVCNILGQNEKALYRTPWKNILHPDDRVDIKYQTNDAGEIFFETRLESPSLGERIINWNILNRGITRGGAAETAFVLSGKDVTDQIKSQESERSRQKMEALGQLAGGVAHEINNLLQPILFSSQMVASKIEDDENMNEKQAQYFTKNMERIERNAQSAAQIVDDILLFSREEQKEREVLNLHEVLEGAVVFVRDLLPVTITVIKNWDEDASQVNAEINKNEMLQIITNMLMNASHAMSGSGKVHIKSALKKMNTAEAEQMKLKSGVFLAIDIADSGYGISEEDISKIFNPFFTTKDVGEGTGLGLSIVYKIVENWGGTIKVSSKKNEGTTFSIYIPVK